jgi:hypothetical protein
VFDFGIRLDVIEALAGLVALVAGGVARFVWDMWRQA